MSFTWLPDAELDPHPRLTWFTECCFDWAVLMLYRKEEVLPADYRLEPGTLVVSNHQRDADIPILTTVLCQREGLHIRFPLPFYASREDLLRRGFLAEHLADWPRPLRAVLGKISLAWFFRIVRAEPMRRVPEYTLAEAFAGLSEPAGDAGERWLNTRGRREAGLRRAGARPARGVHEKFWGLRRLHGEARTALAPEFRTTIAAQLNRLARLLDAGRVVYFAPEGTISRDGRFGRIRAGAWLLTRLAASPPPILPLALSYDPLGPGRLRVVVHVGTPLGEYDRNERRRFDAVLEEEIRRLYPVNASHLLGRFLVAGPETFTVEDLARWLARAASTLAAAGLAVDPLLRRRQPAALAAERLAWLKRKGLVTREAGLWRNRWPRGTKPDWRRPAGIVRYLDNGLADLTQTLAPEHAMELVP